MSIAITIRIQIPMAVLDGKVSRRLMRNTISGIQGRCPKPNSREKPLRAVSQVNSAPLSSAVAKTIQASRCAHKNSGATILVNNSAVSQGLQASGIRASPRWYRTNAAGIVVFISKSSTSRNLLGSRRRR